MSSTPLDDQPRRPVRLPIEPADVEQEDIVSFRGMSLERRGQLLVRACRAAARLQRSRELAGFPPTAPGPWPQSTWDFLSSHARHDRE